MSQSSTFDLWVRSLKKHTANLYGYYLRRLCACAKATPDQLLDEARKDPRAAWLKVKQASATIPTERGRYSALYAFRRFCLDNGVEDLPRPRLEQPGKAKPTTVLTWNQALAVCGAASRPYNVILKLMLHCGWGLGEFFKFNTQETWDAIAKSLNADPSRQRYRFGFTDRKRNREEFYSLIPASLLSEILASGMPLPLRARTKQKASIGKGIILDLSHYKTSSQYIQNAFNTALAKAPFIIEGKPSVHELRDTFRTRASFVNCSPAAAEFAMGHSIDRLGYNKAYYDENWLWSELSKIHGPAVVTEDALASRDGRLGQLENENRDLKARLERLETLSVERLVLAVRTAKQASPKKRKRSTRND